MSKPAICQEAIQWALRQLSFKDFIALFQVVPSLRNVVMRGGSTLTPKNYRQENTVRRLVSILFRRQDFARSVMNVVARVQQETASMPGGDLDSPEKYKALEQHWREKFAEKKDARFLGVSCYRNGTHPILARLGDLLMQTPTFWKTGKVSPSGKAAATIRAQKECIAALEALMPKKAREEMADEEKRVQAQQQPVLPGLLPELANKDLTQPALPGLLPLTKGTPNVAAEVESVAEAAPAETAKELTVEAPASVEVPASAEAPALVESSMTSVESQVLPNSREFEKLRGELKQARERNGELSRDNDKLRREARITRERVEKELNQKTEELKKLQKEYQGVRDDFDDAIDDMRDEFQQAQSEQMASFYAEALGIHPDQLNYLYDVQAATQNFRARVERTLAKQRDLDKKHGTIQKLRGEERALDTLLSRVRDAVEDAIVMAPGLTDLEKELESKLEDIRKQLRKGADGGESTSVDVLPRMLGYLKELPVQETASLERLAEVEAFLSTPLGHGLFAQDEIKAIQAVVAERRKFVEKGTQIIQKLDVVMPGDDGEGYGVRMVPIHRIGWYLDHLVETEVFIDGYNVIKLDPILSVKEKATNGFQVVRSELIEKCKKKAKLFKKMTVVFDGNLPTDNVEHVADNLDVVYAAKKSDDQNADNWIVQKLQELDARDSGSGTIYRWIVTNDNGLRARAAELCDGNVDNATFTAFVS